MMIHSKMKWIIQLVSISRWDEMELQLFSQRWNSSYKGEGGDDDGDKRTKIKKISNGSSDTFFWRGGGGWGSP